MKELHAALIALQEMDAEIARAEARVNEFAPRLQALEEPVAAVQRELEAARTKLRELRTEEERLERNAHQKRDRLGMYQERLTRARTARDQAAVRAELDLVGRALDADQLDLRHTAEQATRTDVKADELIRQLEKAKADIAEERAGLIEGRSAAETELAQLRDRRENHALRLDTHSRRLYERVRAGKSKMVLAPLTSAGACGNCFNTLPVQEQAEVRRGQTLHRCEACGVILYSNE